MLFFKKTDSSPNPASCEEIAWQCLELKVAATRGELGEQIARLVLQHPPVEIQRMKRNFATKIKYLAPGLPRPADREDHRTPVWDLPADTAHAPAGEFQGHAGTGR